MGLRLVKATRFVLESMLRGELRAASSSAPVDLEVCGVLQSDLEKKHQEFTFVCRSSDWDCPVEGAAIPQETLVFTDKEKARV